MTPPRTLTCALLLLGLSLLAPGCSKRKTSYSATTVANTTSLSTTLITSGSAAPASSAAPVATQVATPSQAPKAKGSGAFLDASAALPDSTSDDFGAAAGDFDRDGDLDLFIAANGSPSRVLVNDGGVFSVDPGAFPSEVLRATAALARDLDRDGDLDLLVTSNMEPLRVFQNDGQGRFTLVGSYATNNDTYTYGLAVADFDGDGKLDVFLANAGLDAPSSGQNRLLLGDGRGAFREVTATHLPVRSDDSLDAVAFDFEGDGDLDLLVANFGSPSRLLLNDGQGRFTDRSDAFLPARLTYATSVVAGDFDGDGKLDLYLGNQGAPQGTTPPQGERNALFLGTGGARFLDATASLPNEADSTFDVAALDADDDGKLDLVASTLRGTQRLYLQLGGRLVEASSNLPDRNKTPSSSLSVEVADFNGDGAQDLLYLQRRAKPFLFLNVPQAPGGNQAP